MVLQRFCRDEVSGKNYLKFVLNVTHRELPDIPLVRQYFEEVELLLITETDSIERTVQMNRIASELRALQPHRKNIHAYTNRRRVKYVDLYLLENIVKGLAAEKWWEWGYYCYEASKLFVFNYDDMRYRVGGKTLTHWNAIVDFWQRQ